MADLNAKELLIGFGARYKEVYDDLHVPAVKLQNPASINGDP